MGIEHTQLRPGYPDLRIGAVAGGAEPIDIGFRHKSLGDQPQRPVQVGLRQIGIGLRDLHLRGLARLLLDLHRAIDHRQYLTGVDPLAWLDQHSDDLPAFAGYSDR